MDDRPTLDDVRAWLTHDLQQLERYAPGRSDSVQRYAAMHRLALAALDDAERVTWLESELTQMDSVVLSAETENGYDVDVMECDVCVRSKTAPSLRAAIDAARREGA